MSAHLAQRITDDLAVAMRAGDEDGKRTRRLLKAAIKNAEIEAVGRGKLALGQSLDDEAVVAVLRTQAKQRRDAIALYEQGGREELAAQERRELAIVETYLPAAVPAAEIEALAREHIAAAGATGPADMGKVMGPLMKALQSRADGRLVDGQLVGAAVRRLLGG